MIAVDVEHDRALGGASAGVESQIGQVLVAVFFTAGVRGDCEVRGRGAGNVPGIVVGGLNITELFVSRVRAAHTPHQGCGL